MLFHDDAPSRPLTEHEGLTAYLNGHEARPAQLTASGLATLTPAERATYDRERIAFLSAGITIPTAQYQGALKQLKRTMAENFASTSGHSGMLITGGPSYGKTTSLKMLMRYVQTAYRKAYPTFDTDPERRMPVVFIEVPAGCTGKHLMVAFARFFGMSVASTETANSIMYRVVDMLRTCRTQLIVVDEVHNLQASNRGNGESIDILKALHNQVPATFLYAGIDLDTSALLDGVRGRQMSARFKQTKLERYEWAHPEQRLEWARLVASFEAALPLTEHQGGTLKKQAKLLWDLSDGRINALAKLITGAAIDLIIDPQGRPEAITEELLRDYPVDLAAEQAYARRAARARTTTKSKKSAA